MDEQRIARGDSAYGYQASAAGAMELPDWKPDDAAEILPISLRPEQAKEVWGHRILQVRHFFDESLPACFERTLFFDRPIDTEMDWIFTGPRAGLTLRICKDEIHIVRRFYDSAALREIAGGKTAKNFSEWQFPGQKVSFNGRLRSVTARADSALKLSVLLNGKIAYECEWITDLTRHQLRMNDIRAEATAGLIRPKARVVNVRIDASKQHQKMLGFGGITSIPAFDALSPAGKRQWWRFLKQYNLLVHREYPVGRELNAAMDNWDDRRAAAPHNYGDNFPNGEVSDFDYMRQLRKLGGQVWFEFWALPTWAGDDVEKYAGAMVRYCQLSRERTGGPPEIVGVQNEVNGTPQQWRQMTLALRRRLDEGGFRGVRIHMCDAAKLNGGIARAKALREMPDVWAATDYAATHMYDYQSTFGRPDDFDAQLKEWRELTKDKPFLSTELCVNRPQYQHDSYRLALVMGQLYHKNLTIADASAVCYCWTLLNVVQPAFGQTRSLFVPDEAHGFVPVGSSHQLRVFGAYSRRIREGMSRVEATSDDSDVLASAFSGKDGLATLVLLNRSTRPVSVRVDWPEARFDELEQSDIYNENAVGAATAGELIVLPGATATLTNVKLGDVDI